MAMAPDPEYLQTLLQTFKCFICMEKIQDAHLCPHCSKLCCYSCMHRWLTEQRSQCPHCRATLHLHEIVNCRWVEDLSDQLDGLNSTIGVSSVRQSQEQRCETHNEQLTVFCITCSTTICHRCALFDNSSHCGHSFRPIEEIYNETLAQLGESCDNLKTKEESIKKEIKELDKNIKEIQQAKDQKVCEIRSAVECMMMDLDKELNNKLTSLLTQKNHLVNESEQIEEFLHECDLELSRMPMSQLINHAPRFKRTISAMQKKQAPVRIPVYDDFHSEIIPKFEGGTLVIKSFSDKMLLLEPIYSLPIGCNGVSWRLKVYPSGNGIVRNRYLSVFLELTSGPPGVSRYEYRIEMVNQLQVNDETKNVLREFTSDFEIGECWGYNRFFRLDLLSTEGFLLRNSLILKFSVRPPTYYQKCREQQWYLSKLELERTALLHKFEEFKQKIPDKIKPTSKELQSPKKKLKIKIQSLLDEFDCDEASEQLCSPNKSEDIQEISGETASNLVHPPLSIQTLYDNEFQNRYQGETAQSMFERLSRLFEESDNPDRSSSMHANNIISVSLDNIEYTDQPEYFTEVAGSSDTINPTTTGSKTYLSQQITTDHELHNHTISKNKKRIPPGNVNVNFTNRFLDMTDLGGLTDDIDRLINSVYTKNECKADWEIESTDDEESANKSMNPDHLTKDE
ncbi:E3 ubiquitin-protein ligase TRIM37-like isoform X2 [Sipha flava]|uniref:E3 ubiquitin-protein ligase TRIM37-like isoform X2 n=2 Tax=Sipha flava TaxID=143950 RepID=A0A8B8FLA9_9HEMI|nr:E3 ubiquitin-protein ligase TRIM37-like isoform X2 [Sipha flava]